MDRHDRAVEDQRALMLAYGFKRAQAGKDGVPKTGEVRSIVNLGRVGFHRAHWDGPPDEHMRYIDIRAGGPAWSVAHFEAIRTAIGRAFAELKAILDDERHEFLRDGGVRTRVSNAHEKKKREGWTPPLSESEKES